MVVKKKIQKKSKKLNKKIEGGAGTNDPFKAAQIIKKAGIDIYNEVDIKAIVKDMFALLYDILTGGEKTEAEFRRRVLEQLYNITGGDNCAIKEELCNNPDLRNEISNIYASIYKTLENGVFSYATNLIAVVPGFGPAALIFINGLKVGKDVKQDVVNKFQKAAKIVNTIKNTVNGENPPDSSSPSSSLKRGGTRKQTVQKKLTTKQITHAVKTYLQFLNLFLYVKKKYKNNKTKKK